MIYIPDMNLNTGNHRSIMLIISHLFLICCLFYWQKGFLQMPKLASFFFIYKQKIFMITSSLCAQKQCYKTSEKKLLHY